MRLELERRICISNVVLFGHRASWGPGGSRNRKYDNPAADTLPVRLPVSDTEDDDTATSPGDTEPDINDGGWPLS